MKPDAVVVPAVIEPAVAVTLHVEPSVHGVPLIVVVESAKPETASEPLVTFERLLTVNTPELLSVRSPEGVCDVATFSELPTKI